MSSLKLVPRSPSNDLTEDWLQALAQAGYRSTAARRAVARVLAASQTAMRPQEIYEAAKKLHARIGLVTVYRALEAMESLGLVQSIHLPDGSHGFLAEFSGHQHLLACSQCGKVLYFEGDDMRPLTRALEEQSGYRIEEHFLQFQGLCADCHAH